MLTLYERLAARSIFIHKFKHVNGVAEVLQLSGCFQRLGSREMSEGSKRQADMTSRALAQIVTARHVRTPTNPAVSPVDRVSLLLQSE
jgi:hypothetical protein